MYHSRNKGYSDLRLAGVGMIGVVHSTRAVDAIQRFVENCIILTDKQKNVSSLFHITFQSCILCYIVIYLQMRADP